MINLLSKPHDFIKNDKFDNKQWKGVISEKIKTFPLVCSKYLSSWTGLGGSGHARFPTFNRILHVVGSKLICLTKFLNDSAWLLLEKLKNQVILIKNLNI